MDALISAQAGTALLIQGFNLASIHADMPEQAIPRRAEEVHLLFGEALDLQVLKGVDRDQVVRQLAQETTSVEALQLFLVLLDSELPGEIRSGAAAELDGLLAEEDCRERLERILYARPFPSAADLWGALAHSEGHTVRVQDLLRHLAELQPLVSEVRRAWNGIPDALFASPAERHRFQATLVREGLFRELVLVLRTGSPIESFHDTAMLHPLLKTIQDYQAVILAWAAPFRSHDQEMNWREQPAALATNAAEPPRERGLAGTNKEALLLQLERLPMDSELRKDVLAGAARWSDAEAEMYAGRLQTALGRLPRLLEELQTARRGVTRTNNPRLAPNLFATPERVPVYG